MKPIHTILALAAIIAFVGCATTNQATENMAVAAGFQLITPKNANQESILQSLPPGKVTPIQHEGKQYYVLPDAPNNQAYVGGPKQYQAYQQLRLAKQMSNENLMAAQMNAQAAAWNSWGGWGAWGTGYWY